VLRLLFWIIALPLFVFVVVFAASNPALVTLDLWPFTQLEVPLYSIALVGALIGLVLGTMIGWAQGSSARARSRQLMHELEGERRELLALRERVAKFEAAEQQATIPSTPVAAL
jgi:uncharacterized integral membrane protein